MRTLILKLLVLAAVGAVTPQFARGELVKRKGQGVVTYKKSAGQAEVQAAIDKAKRNALQNYASDFDFAKFQLYQKVESALFADIDRFVPTYTQMEPQIDKTAKSVTVVIDAQINAQFVDSVILNSSTQTPSAAGTLTGTERGRITFVFVAREELFRKSHDPMRTTIQATKLSKEGNEIISVSKDASDGHRAVIKTTVLERTTGGSTEAKAEEVTYQTTTASEVDDAVSSIFTSANWATLPAEDAGLDVEAFQSNFVTSQDISKATIASAVERCRKNKVRYLAVARLVVDLPGWDRRTGLTRVSVSVSANVRDLISELPEMVASVPGYSYAGSGQGTREATQNAIIGAATKAANLLLNQLYLKSLK